MGRWLSTIFLGLILIVAAILIVPSFVDWTQFRSQIEGQASRIVGRDVSIAGEISFRLLPAPELSLNDVAVADSSDVDAPLISASQIEAVAAWGALFQGDIVIDRLRLIEPLVRFTVLKDGRTNWTVNQDRANQAPPQPANEPTPPGGSPFAPLPPLAIWSLDDVVFADIIIDGGTLLYADRRNGAEDRISKIKGRLAFEKLVGPGDGDVLFEIAGEPMRARYRVGSMAPGATTSLSLVLEFTDAPAELKIDGKAQNIADARKTLTLAPVAFDGTIDLKSATAGPLTKGVAALAAFGQGVEAVKPLVPTAAADLPLIGNGKMEITPDLNMGVTELSDLTLSIGKTTWKGRLKFGGPNARIAGNLNTDLVYLDDFKGAGSGTRPGRPVPALVIPGVAAPIKALVDCSCNGQFKIEAGDLLTDGIKLSGFVAEFGFSDDKTKLTLGKISLPGDTDIRLSGRLEDGTDKGLLFDGDVEFSSAEARLFFKWLGIEPEGVSPSKLREIGLKGPMRLVDKGVANASGLRVQDARSVVVPELVGTNLVLDGQSYTVGFSANPISPTALQVLFDGGEFDANAYGVIGALLPASPLDTSAWADTALGRAARFDVLDLDIRLGTLGLGETSAKGLNLSIDRSSDGLALSDITLDDFAGYQIKFNGSRLLDRQADQPLSKARLQIQGGANATLTLPFAEQPLSRDVTLDAEYDEAPGKATWTLSGRMGPIDLVGTGSGTPRGQLMADFDKLMVRATMKEGEAVFAGSLTNLVSHPTFQGNLTVDALSFPSYAQALGYKYEPRKKDLGALSIVAGLSISNQAVGIPQFAASVGQQTGTGNAELLLGGDRAQLDADLKLGAVSLNGFLPKPDAKAAWQTERFNFGFLQRADGEIRLTADRFEVYAFDLYGVTAKLALKDGVLSGQAMTANVYDGAVSLTGTAGWDNDQLAIAGNGALTGIDFEKAAQKLAPRLDVRGSGDVSFNLAAMGYSQFALANTLSGEIAIEGGAGRLQGLDLATWSAGLEKVQSPERFLRLAKDTLSSGSSPFGGMAGRLIASDGKLTPRDFDIDFEKSDAGLSGSINLPTKTQALRLELPLKDHRDLPPARLVYTGPLASPALNYDLAELQRVMLQRFDTSGGGRIGVEDLPPDLQEILKDPP